MKNSKKMLAIVFIAVLSFHLMSATFSAFTVLGSQNTVYVHSESCPQEAKDYAISSYVRFAKGYVDGNGISNYQVVSLGSPFTIGNTNNLSQVYYFPVFSDEEVFATLCVYIDFIQSEDSDVPIYTGIMSEFMVDELNLLLTTPQVTHVSFCYGEDNAVEITTMTGSENSLFISDVESEMVEVYTDISVKISQSSLDIVDEDISPMAATPLRKYLTLSLEGPQGTESWCSPYCCAAIIRYLRGSTTSPTAWSLLNLVYDNPTTSSTFGVEQVYEVAHYYGYSPIQVYGALSESTIVSQIVAEKPIFVAMNVFDYDTNSSGSRHAMVLRGYDTFAGVYSFWNPWYDHYSAMDMSTMQIYDSNANCRFTWNDAFYDW